MRRRQKFNELPVTCRKGTTAEGGQLGVGKAVKSGVDGSGRQVDTPTAGQLPSLVSYCLNRSTAAEQAEASAYRMVHRRYVAGQDLSAAIKLTSPHYAGLSLASPDRRSGSCPLGVGA